MKNTNHANKRAACIAAGFIGGLMAAYPALADDTEVLIGQQLSPGNPNVLFVIDTSGSMQSEVVVGVDYDPTAQYTGSCDPNRYYWSLESTGTITLPDCRFNTYVEQTAFKCETGRQVIVQSGQYRDRFAQWNNTLEPATWTEVVRAASSALSNGAIRDTECAADEGTHGEVAGEYYPADGAAGPWSTDPLDGIDWDTRGDSYSFYSGHYLNWIQQSGTDTTVSTRIQVVQRVAEDVLADISGVNVGLMRFSTNSEGGMVLREMTPVDSGRADIVSAINSLTTQGATPLAETLYEAGQYFAGRPVYFGIDSEGAGGDPLPSVSASQDGNGNYRSPITLQCQRSYVILLTDGLPAGDMDADDRIQRLPGFAENIGSCTDSCLDEMARYLDEVDQRSGGSFPDDQTVQTFTIGFSTDQPLLQNTATGVVPVFDADGNPELDDNGDPVTRPGFFLANDQVELSSAFVDIISAIQTDGDIFTSPSLSVDVQNRLTNREDVYFAMFQPPTRGEPHWDGNLKKYRIGRPSGAATDSVPRILDANGRAAISDDGGFVAGAQSFWSLSPDEGVVTSGGFIGTLTTNRNVYSNITSGVLTDSSNRIIESNVDNLTADLLGVDPDERDALVQWARGANPDGSARRVIGDPLHTSPLLLAYSGDRFALFFGTNDGYLHAIDPESTLRGETDIEHFAFIPRELLTGLARLKANAPQQQFNARKAYGLDGPITAWIDETNNNRVVESGERAYLFVGMRRGGRNYYALDVTDVDNPRLVWSIIGGSGNFAELGQSWSKPVVSRVQWEGVQKQVLFFAGGNDTNQDAKDRPATADEMGRAIYMVEAETGRRLWWASIRNDANLTLEGMTHSIPSDLRVIDTNQDGLDDRIYVGDTKAQVWRFDIDNRNERITGGLLATLGGDTEATNRRIYSAPSVTRIVDENLGPFLTVAVGTGHRAHPLEAEVQDGFYLLRDRNVFAPPINPLTQQVDYGTPIERAQLLDITDNVTPTLDQLETNRGWYIDFDSSEKSLSAPLTVLDRILFTTYIPTPPEPSCQPVAVIGTGRLYTVDILTGAPVNYADSPTPDDRYQDLDRAGIPPSPVLIFTEPPPCDSCDPGEERPVTDITVLAGPQSFEGIDNVPRRTYWVQEDIDR